MRANAHGVPAHFADPFVESRAGSQSNLRPEAEVKLHTSIERAIAAVRKSGPVDCNVIHTLGADASCVLAVDPSRLQQALALLIVAAAHARPGPVRLHTHVSAAGAEIGVAAAGAGLSPSALEAGGTGAAATVCAVAELVRSQGGQLLLRAAGAGRMHTLLIRFPAERTRKAGGSATRRIPTRNADPGGLHSTHVLLVEDDPDALEFLTLILRQAGARVSAFGLAEPAYRFHVGCDDAPDIIVSDIAMPLQDGHSLMRNVREWERDRDRVPVPAIAVSAFSRDEDLRRSIASGFDRHLPKPIDASVLLAEIARWVPSLH
jgi:CheY-like chemotaxis protein